MSTLSHCSFSVTVQLFANWHLRVNSVLGGFTHPQKGKYAGGEDRDERR